MTKAAAKRETVSPVDYENASYALSSKQIGYLRKIRELQSEYEASEGFIKKQQFVKMIHCFMQDLCGYPQGTYVVTTAAYGDESVGSYPHVVPIAYYKNSTLFWFTTSEEVDDVQDLWVKQADVYLNEPCKGDAARDCATNIIFTNFFVVDGAKKNVRNDAWHLWSASDVRGGKIARIDLRLLEKDEDLDPANSAVIEKRLRSLAYQAPPDIMKVDRKGHEALAELMRKAGHDSMAYTAKAKRGEGPLDLPIYGIDQIVANERMRKATALLQVETFDFMGEANGLISKKVSYRPQPVLDRNSLICGDNVEVMQRLYDEYGSFINLIYIDPPFCSNRDYESKTGISGYTDKWSDGIATFLPWLVERLLLMKALLTETGQIFVNLDHHAAHYVKVELDKIFCGSGFRNEIIWHFPSMSPTRTDFPRKHQNILRYAKGKTWTFSADEVRVPYAEATKSRARYGGAGFAAASSKAGYLNDNGKIPDTVWTIPHAKGAEHTKYYNQKPEKLLERIIAAASKPGDVVADFYAGSGTTCVIAQKLGRRWLGVDSNPQAIEVAADRIRRISGQKDKTIGIEIPDFTLATSRGYSKFYASHYHREDVRNIDDTQKGSSLSEFQEFILDCYLPRDGRKGDATLHGFRTERGKEIAVFVGPNRKETKQTDVVQFLESVGRKAKTVDKVEILGWSFSSKLLKALDQLIEANGLDIGLKRIHISPLTIEDALRTKNVKFLPAARATVDIDRGGSSLSCTLNLLSPISDVRDIHWFIYPDASAELEKIQYNFIKDDDGSIDDEAGDELEETLRATVDLKRHLKSLALQHTFKGIPNGEYRIYVRVTDRRGHPTAIIEDIKVAGDKVISLPASMDTSEQEAA